MSARDLQPSLQVGETVYLPPGHYEEYEFGQWVLYRDSKGKLGTKYRAWADALAKRIADDPHTVVQKDHWTLFRSNKTGAEWQSWIGAERKPWDPQTASCLKSSRKRK